MVDMDDLDIDKDAKMILEEVADEAGVDISELQIPKKKLEALAEAFDEEDFRDGIEQAFKQL